MNPKLTRLPLLVIAACLVAALYGLVHNQVSYTLGPSYFHDFKFQQFGLPGWLENRLGASWVGILASWWMGALIGLIIGLVCLQAKDADHMQQVFKSSAYVVVWSALISGVLGLLFVLLTTSIETVPGDILALGVAQPVRFWWAGQLHNFTCMGGLFGLFFGAMWAYFRARVR